MFGDQVGGGGGIDGVGDAGGAGWGGWKAGGRGENDVVCIFRDPMCITFISAGIGYPSLMSLPERILRVSLSTSNINIDFNMTVISTIILNIVNVKTDEIRVLCLCAMFIFVVVRFSFVCFSVFNR